MCLLCMCVTLSLRVPLYGVAGDTAVMQNEALFSHYSSRAPRARERALPCSLFCRCHSISLGLPEAMCGNQGQPAGQVRSGQVR